MKTLPVTKYLAVIERADDGSLSAYVPDLPGCVTSGGSVDEMTELIREAIRLHIESLVARGEPVPEPTMTARVTKNSGA